MRTRTWAATGAVALGLAALTAGGAQGAPPEADATLPLIGTDVDPFDVNALITDDAVYVSHTATMASAELYRRTLTPQGDGLAVGPLELLARTRPHTAVAEDAGTLAYVRALDGRLVLRAPDGTETRPAWGTAAAMGAGPQQLTDRWLVTVPGAAEASPALIARATGATVDLAATVTAPELAGATVESVDVTDDRALFTMRRSAGSSGVSAVVTVPLGASGPTGAATVLDEVTWDPSGPPSRDLTAVGTDAGRVVWQAQTLAGGTWSTSLHWWDASTDTKGSLADAGQGVALEGATVVTTTGAGGALRYDWRDLAGDPAAPTTTLTVEGWATDVHGTLLALINLRGGELTGTTTLVDASGRALTAPHGSGALAAWPFTDVHAGDPFVGEILWLADRGVVQGYADGTFRALGAVNRDAMAALLYRTTHPGGGRAPSCTSAPFADVPVTHPFCGEIAWLKTTGIAQGWSDGTFRPGAPISREAMAAFLYRLAHHSAAAAPACTTAPFSDVRAGSPFCGEIAWLAANRVSTGWGDGTFRPAAQIERQAMAAFLVRAVDGGLVGSA